MSATPFRRSSIRRRVIGVSALALACVPLLRAEKLVTVRAVAEPAYVQRRETTFPPKRETYVFAKGQFFNGVTFDRTLVRTPFRRIAETLAYDLREQNYFPSQDIQSADLVIVVHWGVTWPNDRGAELLALNPDILRDAMSTIDGARETPAADTTLTSSLLGVAAAAEANLRGVTAEVGTLYERTGPQPQSNGDLLGLTSALAGESDGMYESEMAHTLHEMVNEERYFIIMVAYDAPALREGKKHRLWTSRMSIRAAGVNFLMGLDRMSSAAARFHGTRNGGLALEYGQDRKGIVKIGELKVINDAPAKP